MYSTCPSREVDHFLGWTASRSGTVSPVSTLASCPLYPTLPVLAQRRSPLVRQILVAVVIVDMKNISRALPQ